MNEHACLIAFTDGKEENVNHVKSILQVRRCHTGLINVSMEQARVGVVLQWRHNILTFPSSQSHAETEHAKGVDNKEIFFFWGGEDDICTSIRDFCGLDDEPENLIILLNIPGQEIHVCDQVN